LEINKLKKKKILVVLGGTSRERAVSLESAKSCMVAIKKLGHKITLFDPKFTSLIEIKKKNPDIIFNALHGKDGEDGKIQSYFEHFRIPYTHSGVVSSMIAMDKNLSKKLFIKNKVRTPNYFFLNSKNYNNFNIQKMIKKNNLNFPIVIKPNDEGSSIGVKICKNLKLLKNEFEKGKKIYSNLIFENYIPGQEIQVAVMGGKSIGAIELKPKRKFYDYNAKYKKSAKTLHIMPASISQKKYTEVLKISEKANKILKCKGITRCDFRFYKNKFFLLEVNTQPGMTSLSLVPEIAKYYKISFTKLVNWMIKDSSINR
tara:strand:- start:2350 stop:3294 length:945 start_codon:yes stop_codon:yes gene_type:complete